MTCADCGLEHGGLVNWNGSYATSKDPKFCIKAAVVELKKLREEVFPEIHCPICKRLWCDPPGEIYCSHQHGQCPICKRPRTAGSCNCMKTKVDDWVSK